MRKEAWTKWLIQTAERWSDIAPIVVNTGLDEVDADHQRLVGYILDLNHLIDKLEKDRFNMVYLNEQQRLLSKLREYAEGHFAREEKLMEKYSIVDPKQAVQHARILEMLDGAISDFQSGRATISASLKTEIMEWVVVHINEVDRSTFQISNWRGVLEKAEKWDDLKFIIKHCGVPIVDSEHRELVECTLQLGGGAKKGLTAAKAKKVLKELGEIVERHFSDEESFIEKHSLPGLGKQCEQHAVFRKILKERSELPDMELLKSLGEMKKFIIEWWCRHINELDYATVSFQLHAMELVENHSGDEDMSWMLTRTGEKGVDAQHQRLLHIMEKLPSGPPGGVEFAKEGREAFDKTLAFLKEHCAFEERLMKEKGAPLFEIHADDHAKIVRQYSYYREQLENGSSVFSTVMKNKLIKSLVSHTNGLDAETFGVVSND